MPKFHDQLRDSKGKFSKQKKINKRLKCVAAMNRAKSEKSNQNNLCIGQRIVELSQFGKNLKCCRCKNVLSLEKIQKERRIGLNSILDILCEECAVITQVPTGKMHVTKNKKHSDVNTKPVLGAVHADVDCTALNELLTSINIPAISTNLYEQYEHEIGPAIEEAAKDEHIK